MSKPNHERHDGDYDKVAHTLMADLLQWSYDPEQCRRAIARLHELAELTFNSRPNARKGR